MSTDLLNGLGEVDQYGAPANADYSGTDFAFELQQATAAVKLEKSRWGVSKSLTSEQKERAASEFCAESRAISASKKLVDTKHPLVKAVTKHINAAKAYWESCTVPFPEDGIRLIRTDRIEEFEHQMASFVSAMNEAVDELDYHLEEIKDRARHDLGELYNEADYPESVKPLFKITYSYPSVKPDERLLKLNPELYERESQKIAAKFAEAVELAESAFAEKMAEMVERLLETLVGEKDGKPKKFYASAVTNIQDFVKSFKQLSVGSNAQLEQCVEKLKLLTDGVAPEQVKKNSTLRSFYTEQFGAVQKELEAAMVLLPKRKFRDSDYDDE